MAMRESCNLEETATTNARLPFTAILRNTCATVHLNIWVKDPF